MRTIPQRELRNRISQVLRKVEAGEHLRITVAGRPVADLIPVAARRTYVQRAEVADLIRHAPLDAAFLPDVRTAAGTTIEDL